MSMYDRHLRVSMVRQPQPPKSTCADVSSSHPFFIRACHLVGRSLCASAACYAGFACALTARGLAQAPQGAEDDASGDGYDAGAKVSVAELLAKDAEDESLRRYKESLLGAAAKGHTATDPNDKRRVVITELRVIFEDRPGGDVTYTLNSAADVAAMKHSPFVMKVAHTTKD